ncbi:MAG: hypothetical protein R2784_19380 [Saprospiraceae bacterium]
MKKHFKTLILLSAILPFFLGSCIKERIELAPTESLSSQGKVQAEKKFDLQFPEGTSILENNFFILPEGYQFLTKTEEGDFDLSSSGFLQEGVLLNMEDNKLMFDKIEELEGYEILPTSYFNHPIFQQFFDDIASFLNQTEENPEQLSGEKIWVPVAIYGQVVLVEIPKEYDTTTIYMKPLEKSEYLIIHDYIVKTKNDFSKNFMEQE